MSRVCVFSGAVGQVLHAGMKLEVPETTLRSKRVAHRRRPPRPR